MYVGNGAVVTYVPGGGDRLTTRPHEDRHHRGLRETVGQREDLM